MNPDKPTRRQILSLVPGMAISAGLGQAEESSRPSTGVIAVENAKPGTKDWLLTKPRIDPASRYRCPSVEGYCSHASIEAGGTIRFHVSTNPVSRFTLEIYRLGWYGGEGGRLMARLGSFEGRTQEDPPVGEKRLRNCQWTVSAEWTVPADAVSGVYLGKLTAEKEGIQSYVIFIVRDQRKADFIFQCSDHTWQAYNRWPRQDSLYDDGKNEWYWGGNVEVSFNRPYGKYCQILDQPLSAGSGDFMLWEFPFVFWMEEQGYDVTYISNTDTHRDPAGLLRGKGFLSVGHDEYWTREMYDHVKAAVAAGVNAGFFSGNAVCGRIAWHEERRAFERTGVFGPPGGTQEFVAMSSLPHERPYANELTGAHSTGPVTGSADWVCALPDHWIFQGTGLKKGEGIPGLVGWEWHGDPAKIEGLEIIATAPTFGAPGQPNGGVFTATIYPGPKGNFVFNAGTCWWADGLSAPPGYVRPGAALPPKGPDARARRVTANVLARMSRKP